MGHPAAAQNGSHQGTTAIPANSAKQKSCPASRRDFPGSGGIARRTHLRPWVQRAVPDEPVTHAAGRPNATAHHDVDVVLGIVMRRAQAPYVVEESGLVLSQLIDVLLRQDASSHSNREKRFDHGFANSLLALPNTGSRSGESLGIGDGDVPLICSVVMVGMGGDDTAQ